MRKFRFFKQFDQMDCGPTCLRMIMNFHGKKVSMEKLREKCYFTKHGVSLMGISHASESFGLKSMGAKLDYNALLKKAPLPCILFWENSHFVVLYKITKRSAYIADPAKGKRLISKEDLIKSWLSDSGQGLALLFETTPDFHKFEEEEHGSNKKGLSYFLNFFKPHKNLLLQIFFAIIFTSLVNLIVPFITQSIVDIGILGKDLNFIYLVLAGQLILSLGSIVVSFIQAWISLHLSIRISLSFIITYVAKVLEMPFSFFEHKTLGDIIQRINDNSRIEAFINSALFSILISVINFIIYSSILISYNKTLLIILVFGNIAYILWIWIFLKKRREFDDKNFKINSDSENKFIQLFTGALEIKLNNIEKERRWEWEKIQAKGFRLSKKILLWNQFQSSGAIIIQTVIGLIITLLVSNLVIEGKMTFGMMLSVQFILGQVQAPLSSLIGLVHSYQDAKISLERLSEVIDYKEDKLGYTPKSNIINDDITIENVSFHYEGPFSPEVLKNINIRIPKNSTTAIVGRSGSGKTTILKLLLKVNKPSSGKIKLGNVDLEMINDLFWRENCGFVMQDSFIFSDTILNNIVLKSYEKLDFHKFNTIIEKANIKEWIESLPSGYETRIGDEGVGISAGQKQRILIAIALYKNPPYIFFDEATNALDSNNEKEIILNIEELTKDKTVIIVAHRLSTIKNADQIIVIDNGEIREVGNHNSLLNNKSIYYELIKNQI